MKHKVFFFFYKLFQNFVVYISELKDVEIIKIMLSRAINIRENLDLMYIYTFKGREKG